MPSVPPGGAYVVRFTQLNPAGVIGFWAYTDGEVVLTSGGAQLWPIPGVPSTTGFSLGGLPAGDYELTLRNNSGVDSGDSRLALFYDATPACAEAPTGELAP